jgi:predicted MFS family arabinose efflux permease
MGVVVGPPLFGLLATLFGTYRSGFLALTLTSAICCWVLWRIQPQPTALELVQSP